MTKFMFGFVASACVLLTSMTAGAQNACGEAFKAPAALPALSVAQETALTARLQAIMDNAQVANGDIVSNAYTPSKFTIAAVEASLAKNREDVLFDDGTVRHSFMTTVGYDKVIERLKTEHDFIADDEFAPMTELANLQKEGLIQAILVRDTKQIVEETYLIPIYIDIYVAYTVNGVEKGQHVGLYYEVGD